MPQLIMAKTSFYISNYLRSLGYEIISEQSYFVASMLNWTGPFKANVKSAFSRNIRPRGFECETNLLEIMGFEFSGV